MGSHIDSSSPSRDRTNGGQEDIYVPAFKSPEGCRKEDIKELSPAVADEHGMYQVYIAPKYLERLQAQNQAFMPLNAIDAQYSAEFQRLERALEANAQAVRALEADAQAVPSSVTGGSVPILSVVDVTSGGDTIFGTVLEEHEATGQTK